MTIFNVTKSSGPKPEELGKQPNVNQGSGLFLRLTAAHLLKRYGTLSIKSLERDPQSKSAFAGW